MSPRPIPSRGLFGSPSTGSDHLGNADTGVAASGQAEIRKCLFAGLNLLDPPAVPDMVLGHRIVPAVDLDEHRLASDPEHLAEIGDHQVNHRLIG